MTSRRETVLHFTEWGGRALVALPVATAPAYLLALLAKRPVPFIGDVILWAILCALVIGFLSVNVVPTARIWRQLLPQVLSWARWLYIRGPKAVLGRAVRHGPLAGRLAFLSLSLAFLAFVVAGVVGLLLFGVRQLF